MHLVIPVRHPEFWGGRRGGQALRDCSGSFPTTSTPSRSCRRRPAAGAGAVLHRVAEGAFMPDEIVLFSGGLDFFAGVGEGHGRRGQAAGLVGNFRRPGLERPERPYRGTERCRAPPAALPRAGEHQERGNPAEGRSRKGPAPSCSPASPWWSRGCSGRYSFTFYENGVVSLKIPIEVTSSAPARPGRRTRRRCAASRDLPGCRRPRLKSERRSAGR